MNNKKYLLLGVAAIALTGVLMKAPHHNALSVQDTEQAKEILAAKTMAEAQYFKPRPTVAGNYLAARFAVSYDDLVQASKFYDQALASSTTDKQKDFLYERTLPAALGAGDMKEAVQIAQKMDLKKPTATAQLAVLTQIIEGFKENDSAKINKLLPELRTDGFGRLLKPLLVAWTEASEGKYAQAEQTLQKLKQEYPSLQPLVQMHTAFLYDLQGKKAPAEIYYMNALNDNLSVRSAYIIAQFYERQGKTAEVLGLYKRLAEKMPGSPLPFVVIDRVNHGQFNKDAFIQKPRDGVAAAFYDVATVLHQEGSSRLAILYAQMAHYLSPNDEFTSLLMGDILSATLVNHQAESYLDNIDKNSDLYVLAQMRLVQLYEQSGDKDKSIAILKSLRKNALFNEQATIELGDLYRREEKFDKAIPYYTDVLKSKTNLVESDWVLLYSRGICYERNNEWDKAEADLKKAMELSPQQPEVLNYLAYSWADHGKNLPQALDMLQKALAGAPDDPYITDSVGWALYKNGQADEAVGYLESAIQQLPEDPVINDHLGDIYWKVGRKLEARFQWERALKNTKDTEKKLRAELEAKLLSGPTENKKMVSN